VRWAVDPFLTTFTPDYLDKKLNFRISKYIGAIGHVIASKSSLPGVIAIDALDTLFRFEIADTFKYDALFLGVDAGTDELRWEAIDSIFSKIEHQFPVSLHVFENFNYYPDIIKKWELALSALAINEIPKFLHE